MRRIRERSGGPLPDDWVQAPDHALGGQRKIGLDAKPFTVEIVQHVQQPECPAIAEAICHEVH